VADDLLSIVVPSYRGRESLPVLLERLRALMTARGQRYEVIVVNDSSPDDTWPVLEKLAPSHPELVAIDLLHNHGQMLATFCGMAHARGDLVATMDDDLQHIPEELGKLVDALREHPEWDAVVGAWPRDQGLLRDLGSWLFARLDRLAYRTPKGFRATSFRLMRRPVADAVLSHGTRMPVIGALMRQATNRIHNVEVAHAPRAYGRSGFIFGSGVRMVLTNFFQGTTLPLQLLARFGLFSALLAAILGTLLISRWALGFATPAGWASSVVAIVFFGGATLFGLGILGEYFHLMLQEVRRPPRWLVRSRLGAAGERPTADR
jgi:glycosyltransferase involved in cell wall biosynthesis